MITVGSQSFDENSESQSILTFLNVAVFIFFKRIHTKFS